MCHENNFFLFLNEFPVVSHFQFIQECLLDFVTAIFINEKLRCLIYIYIKIKKELKMEK